MLTKKIRHKIGRVLSILPDKTFLSIIYLIKLKRFISWDNPKRFTEKIQLYKTFYRDPKMCLCTDKYLVRDYVSNKLNTDKYLNELYQIVEDAKDIDFERLPKQFVIKTTDGGNGDNVYVCRDKSSLDKNAVIKKINGWKNKHYENIGKEWAYTSNVGSKIIIEKYLEDSNNSDGSIDDYKFLCFNGRFRYLWVDKNRYSNHKKGFWNQNLKFLDNYKDYYDAFDSAPALPENINQMISIAEKLSEDFPFSRVDLYNINGHIYFGEITFYPFSGYAKYSPDSFDFELGQYFTQYQ